MSDIIELEISLNRTGTTGRHAATARLKLRGPLRTKAITTYRWTRRAWPGCRTPTRTAPHSPTCCSAQRGTRGRSKPSLRRRAEQPPQPRRHPAAAAALRAGGRRVARASAGNAARSGCRQPDRNRRARPPLAYPAAAPERGGARRPAAPSTWTQDDPAADETLRDPVTSLRNYAIVARSIHGEFNSWLAPALDAYRRLEDKRGEANVLQAQGALALAQAKSKPDFSAWRRPAGSMQPSAIASD